MATDPVGAKLYDQFAPPERLTLMLSALARGDKAEACRLRDTCPRKMYTQSDDAFESRLQMAFDTMAVVFIDVRCMWGKLHVLRWAMDAARDFAPAGVIGASLSFVDGWRFGQGRSQLPFFARRLPPLTLGEAGEHHAIGAGEHEDDEGDVEARDGRHEDDAAVREQVVPRQRTGEFRRRVEAVESRVQRAASLLTLSLLGAERDGTTRASPPRSGSCCWSRRWPAGTTGRRTDCRTRARWSCTARRTPSPATGCGGRT